MITITYTYITTSTIYIAKARASTRRMWLSLFLLLLALLVNGSQGAEADEEPVSYSQPTGSSDKAKKLNILMVSSNHIGHMTKLLALGEQLAQRGHNVTYLLSLHETELEKQKSLVEKHGIHLWNVSTEDLPSLGGHFLERRLGIGFYTAAITETKLHLAGLTKIATKHINETLSKGEWDFIIAHDLFVISLSCMRTVHDFPHLYIGTFPTLTHLLPTWPWPGIIHGASSDNLSSKDRVFNSMQSLAMTIFNYLLFSQSLAEVSEYCPSVTLYKAFSQIGVTTPYIIPTVMGLEYPRTIEPLTEYTGPLIAQAATAPLTGELKDWLTSKPDKSVVYISMGSTWPLDEKGGRAFLEGVMSTNFSLLWSLRKSNQWILEGLDVDPDRVLISDWTPQVSVLGSEAIHSAILHGGFNGVVEALWSGVPTLVVPQQPEQLYNAGRVHFNGLGIYIDHDALSSAKITESLKALDTGEYQSKVAKLQKVMRMAGGVERAADLVEFYEDVGYAHLVPAYAKYQWSVVQYYNIDVYALMVLTLVLIIWCLKSCCKYVCKRCCNKAKKKKKD